jgi:APA family basic amino acid/polyamine antiporter
MSRDGLLPPLFSRVHPRFQTPHLSSIGVGFAVAAIAALFPLDEIVELVNIGTLFAFVVVSIGVVVLRYTQPELHRPFRCPWVPVVPILAVVSCGYLMAQLPALTWERFVIWLVIGLAIYAFYGRRHSRVRKAGLAP